MLSCTMTSDVELLSRRPLSVMEQNQKKTLFTLETYLHNNKQPWRVANGDVRPSLNPQVIHKLR